MNLIRIILALLEKFTKNSSVDSSSTRIKFKKPKRKVSRVFVHCSATDNPEHDNVQTITSWHIKRGFNGIGYHYYIDGTGTIHNGRSLESTPAAQKGHNTGTIAICVFGLTNFSQESMDSLVDLCHAITKAYKGKITFHGHREVSNKTCPVFDYKSILNLNDKGELQWKK